MEIEFKMPSLMASSWGVAFPFLNEVYRMRVLHATCNPGKGFSEQQALHSDPTPVSWALFSQAAPSSVLGHGAARQGGIRCRV